MPSFSVHPAGLRIVDPAAMGPLKDDPPLVFSDVPGTGVVVLVQSDSGVVLGMVEGETTIELFADDKGLALTFNGGPPLCRQLPAYRDTGCFLLEARSTEAPSLGATEVLLRANLRLYHGESLDTRDFENVALAPGWMHPDLDIRIVDVKAGAEGFSLSFEVGREVAWALDGLLIIGADGQDLTLTTGQVPLEGGAWLRRVELTTAVEVATLRFSTWSQAQPVNVEVHVALALRSFHVLPL